jgi:predicted transcriptional regulator
MAEQEWFTIQELAEQWKISYSKLRAAVDAASNLGAIKIRPRPGDNRIQEIHRDSLEKLKQAAGL